MHSRKWLIVEIAELFLIDRSTRIRVCLNTAELSLQIRIFKHSDKLVPIPFIGLKLRKSNSLILLRLHKKHETRRDNNRNNEDSRGEEKVDKQPVSFLFDPLDSLVEGV